MNRPLAGASIDELEFELIRRYQQWATDDKSVRSDRVVGYLTTAIAQRREGKSLKPGWRERLRKEMRASSGV